MAAPRFTTPPHVITRRHATTHHPGTTRRHRVTTGLDTAVDAQAMAALVTGGPATAAVEVTGMVAVVATMVIAHRPKGQDPVVVVPALAGMAITVAEEVAVAPHRADLLAEATSVRTATSAEAATVVPAAATDKPTQNGALRSAVFLSVSPDLTDTRQQAWRCQNNQYPDRSASGWRPSQAFSKCASITANGMLAMSCQCQCGA